MQHPDFSYVGKEVFNMNIPKIGYCIEWCPVCKQGWIFVYKEKDSGTLFIACQECLSEWVSPESLKKQVVPTQNVFKPASLADMDDIQYLKWNKYIIGEIKLK